MLDRLSLTPMMSRGDHVRVPRTRRRSWMSFRQSIARRTKSVHDVVPIRYTVSQKICDFQLENYRIVVLTLTDQSRIFVEK
jgi:hypothetical protein